MKLGTWKKIEPYPPNKKIWQVGDLVIHEYDDKHFTMLMRVIGYTKEGRVQTKYIYNFYRSGSEKHYTTMKKVWENPLEALLDPKDFGIEVPA